MRLNAFLDLQGPGALTKLADRLKTSKGFLSDIAAGRRGCSLAFARQIRIATKGAVTVDDLADERAEYLASQPEEAA